MYFNIIAAVCNNNGIGKNNSLPWHYKEELRFFSKLTKGDGNNAIIMGMNTWNSIPKKPLPNRFNIVLTKNSDSHNNDSNKNVRFLKSIDEVMNFCLMKNFDICWVIGGTSIYEQYIKLPYINYIFTSVIPENHDCDCFFPKIPNNFIVTNRKTIETSKNIKIDVLEYHNSLNYR